MRIEKTVLLLSWVSCHYPIIGGIDSVSNIKNGIARWACVKETWWMQPPKKKVDNIIYRIRVVNFQVEHWFVSRFSSYGPSLLSCLFSAANNYYSRASIS